METNNNIIGFKVSYQDWYFTRIGITTSLNSTKGNFKTHFKLYEVYLAQMPLDVISAYKYCQMTSSVRGFNFEPIHGPVKEKFSLNNWFKCLLTLKK